MADKKRDYRNARPKTKEEIEQFGDEISKKVSDLLENQDLLFLRNTEYLRSLSKLNQRELCEEKLQGYISPAQFAMYKQEGKLIPRHAIMAVAAAYGLTFGDLCETIIGTDPIPVPSDPAPNPVTPRPVKEYEKCLGTFDIAYFDPSKPVGENHEVTEDSISFGVMAVYSTKTAMGASQFHVSAIIPCTSEQRNSVATSVEDAEVRKNTDMIRKNIEKIANSSSDFGGSSGMSHLYEGNIMLTEQMMEIKLNQVNGRDVIHLMTHNRVKDSSEGKDYLGGLATMMSVSRGAEHMPCVQAVILSRGTKKKSINEVTQKTEMCPASRFEFFSAEKLASMIYFAPPKVSLKDEVEAIVEWMGILYGNGESVTTALSDEDKKYCLEVFIEKKISEALKRNALSYYKIPLQMDSEVYQMLKGH